MTKDIVEDLWEIKCEVHGCEGSGGGSQRFNLLGIGVGDSDSTLNPLHALSAKLEQDIDPEPPSVMQNVETLMRV